MVCVRPLRKSSFSPCSDFPSRSRVGEASRIGLLSRPVRIIIDNIMGSINNEIEWYPAASGVLVRGSVGKSIFLDAGRRLNRGRCGSGWLRLGWLPKFPAEILVLAVPNSRICKNYITLRVALCMDCSFLKNTCPLNGQPC